MFAKLKNILKPKSEKLTDAVVNRLVGYTNVVYYNYKTNAFNRKEYNGQKQDVWLQDIAEFEAFKAQMEAIPEFYQHYAFVAPVTMTILSGDFPDRAGLITNPQYNRNGTAVVGNIIVKNKATAMHELYGASWVGVCNAVSAESAARRGTKWFAEDCVRFSIFCKALIAAHAR